ncbi:MAG: hypothetical protein DMG38_07480 [Acidobacteria bacterium]|nr:MAG: hypothetical protein DMG38_07480 [Acidobacteriota bacterium]
MERAMGIEPMPEGWEYLAGTNIAEKRITMRQTIQSRRMLNDKHESDAESAVCHENVTQIAEHGGKNAANNNKGRRKQVAGICPNLLNPFD